MIEVTPLAAEKLSAYLTENKIDTPVRITAMNSCAGSSLGLALDERKGGDYAHEDKAFTLLVDQDLSQSCGKITVDYIEKGSSFGSNSGFSITSAIPPAGNGGCGGSCSSGGCGC